jgi:xanthine dehydrogenase D subunit
VETAAHGDLDQLGPVAGGGALVIAGDHDAASQVGCFCDAAVTDRAPDQDLLDLDDPSGERRGLTNRGAGADDAITVEVERRCAVEQREVVARSGEPNEPACRVATSTRQHDLGDHPRLVIPRRGEELRQRHRVLPAVDDTQHGVEDEQHRDEVGQPPPSQMPTDRGQVAQRRRPHLHERAREHTTSEASQEWRLRHRGQRGRRADRDVTSSIRQVRHRQPGEVDQRRHAGGRVERQIGPATHETGRPRVLREELERVVDVSRPEIVLQFSSRQQGLHDMDTTLVGHEDVTERRHGRGDRRMSLTADGRAATSVRGGVGESVPRPDGLPKATGTFEFLSDMGVEGMVWGATRRAFEPHARIARLDTAPALAMPGVLAVLTQADVPGHRYQGQHVTDQPVLAEDEIRHWGESVAIVAAIDEHTARRAADAIEVDLEPLEPVIDLDDALGRGQVYRHIRVRRGEQDHHGEVIVEGCYETATVDQAPLGTEAGLAIPDGHGGVDVWGPTQWTHIDHSQLVACLGLAADQVRVHIGGLGGAFGAREDLSLQTHLAMLALHAGRPVKMVYDRAESFAGHVKRHAARMWYRHEADRQGRLVRVEARLLLDGGAYEATSAAVIANATYFAVGPYRCPITCIDGYALRTNHPPSGAMRGFGSNQPCFAYEAQMDRLAAELGIDPVELRLRNALEPGDQHATTGQTITEPLPLATALRTVAALPLPDDDAEDDPRRLPGGVGLTTSAEQVVRGVGYAVGFKNTGFSEGFDDYAEARVALTADGAVVHTAAIEVGQGMITVLQQIARTTLGVERVTVVFDDTSQIGSAGSSSASRQTQMTGGAVHQACQAVRDEALSRAAGDALDDHGVWRDGELMLPWAALVDGAPISHLVRYRHPLTETTDENGQGTVHADFCVAAQRAVVDVDPELGLVRVVQVDTAQDVGFAINPLQLLGQIEGGIAQGMGAATMEVLVIDHGVVRNASFTDYLLPTTLDMPDVHAVLIEEPVSWSPFGARGMAELPTVTSTPAIVAAIRAATGRPLRRAPVSRDEIVGLAS